MCRVARKTNKKNLASKLASAGSSGSQCERGSNTDDADDVAACEGDEHSLAARITTPAVDWTMATASSSSGSLFAVVHVDAPSTDESFEEEEEGAEEEE